MLLLPILSYAILQDQKQVKHEWVELLNAAWVDDEKFGTVVVVDYYSLKALPLLDAKVTHSEEVKTWMKAMDSGTDTLGFWGMNSNAYESCWSMSVEKLQVGLQIKSITGSLWFITWLINYLHLSWLFSFW